MDTPAEWTVKFIKFVCLKTEQWIPNKDKRESFHYIDVSSVSNSTFTIKDTSLVKADAAPGRARKVVKWQDTIFATIRPSLKRIAFIPQEYDNQIASTAFCVLRPNQKQVTPLYVYFFLLSDLLNTEISGLQHGASYPAITDKDVLNQTIPLPPLAEQQEIAAVLFKIQQAIGIQESIIEKTRELKKSTLHHVFTHGLRGEMLKETEIGPMPESWEAARVGKYCQKPEYGFTESAIADEIGPKFLRITDITENGVNWHTVPYCRCSQNLFPKYELKENDILFARIGATTGKSHIVKNPPRAIFASYLIRLRPLYDVVPAYLYDFFNSEAYWNQVNANKMNNLKGGVNSSFLSDIIFPLPSKSEQMEIANIILTIDHKIGIYTAKKTALQDLFKTMLNKLMTGEIRVKDLDIDVSEVNT